MRKFLITIAAATCLSAQYIEILGTDYPANSRPQLNLKPSIRSGSDAPTGACTSTYDLYIRTSNNSLYGCASSTWTVIGGAAAWGGITGTLSAQTDLQTALNGKISTGGLAGSATVLATARAINGVNFDGSAPITITANLPSNPTACAADEYVYDIAADGTLSCSTLSLYTIGTGLQQVGDEISIDTAVVPTKSAANTFAELQTLQKGVNIASSTALATAGDLRYNGGTVQFRDGSGSQTLMNNPFTTRGDLVIQGASGPTRLAAGTSGYFLMANGAAADPSYQIPNASQVTNAFDKSTSNALGANYMDITEMTVPSAPGANVARIYSKDDAGTTKVCYKDSAAAETCIGASSAALTAGALVFGGGAGAAPTFDATNLFWDNSNKRLGIGTNAPPTQFAVEGASAGIALSRTASGGVADPFIRLGTVGSTTAGGQFRGIDSASGIKTTDYVNSVIWSWINATGLSVGPNSTAPAGNRTLGVMNATATTGITTATFQAGQGQSTNALSEWRAYNATLGSGTLGFSIAGDTIPQWGNVAEPTCNSANRGKVTMVQGGAGVADTFRICRKDAADAYAWTALY